MNYTNHDVDPVAGVLEIGSRDSSAMSIIIMMKGCISFPASNNW